MKFLVAVDGSDAGKHAIELAVRLADPHQASLALLTVIEPVTDYYWPGVLPTGEPIPQQAFPVEQMEQARRSVAEAVLAQARARCETAGLPCETHIEIGAPRHAICEVAEREPFDLLIIGSRGLGSVQRLMLGSVSDYVIHHAPCPVLVVR